MPPSRETPAMQQYYRFKNKHAGCVLLFRIGDFYEMFDDDAVTVSRAIGLTLTQRSEGIPMAGLPHHQLDVYLKKLTAAGFRVAVCEQLIDAGQAKGVIPRAVTRVITPGTLVDESMLEADRAVAVACVMEVARSGSSRDGAHDPSASRRVALAVMEVATGEFVVLECALRAIADEIAKRGVREVLLQEPMLANDAVAAEIERAARAMGASALRRPAWHFRAGESSTALKEHFKVASLQAFGLREDDALTAAAGALLRYAQETQTADESDLREAAAAAGLTLRRGSLSHLQPPRRVEPSRFLVLDAVSLRALEVERTVRESVAMGVFGASAAGAQRGMTGDGTLAGVFLGAGAGKGTPRTAMGRRLLRSWMCAPSCELQEIHARQRVVRTFVGERVLSEHAGESLAGVQDIARIAGRVALARATPRDIVALARSITAAGLCADSLQGCPALIAEHAEISRYAHALTPLASRVHDLCVLDPPAQLRDGGLIKDGVDPILDEARLLQRDAGEFLAQYQARLVAEHNLPSLKVGYNKVAGYFIELPTAQARTAPPELRRMQTLRNAERYTTPELSRFESKVTTAQSRALEREKELFGTLCDDANAQSAAIGSFADAIARLDTLLAFADKAAHKRWIEPEVVDAAVLRITQGKHPVLDELLGGQCVGNDSTLGGKHDHRERASQESEELADQDTAPLDAGSLLRSLSSAVALPSLSLITGPNMAGKSTYIRMVALLTLLAHTGSSVPAKAATIGLTDRIFTRIGADDALHAGLSTFMVEMVETAHILHHATARSLVVLDEVGRGTSTLDGLSLAWAIVERLAGGEGEAGARTRAPAEKTNGPRTLFATHYHELTDLEERLPGLVQNLHVAVREWPGKDGHAEIIFLHQIVPGRADQSYGLHVARLAGMPKELVARAGEVLAGLAVHHGGASGGASRSASVGALGTSASDAAAAQGSADARSAKRNRRTSTAAVPERSSPSHDQFALFKEFLPHPAIDALREMKLDTLSPMQAFDTLRTLGELVRPPGSQ